VAASQSCRRFRRNRSLGVPHMSSSALNVPDRRHIIPDRQYIADNATTVSQAFLDLAAATEADELDRTWFETRVADAIELIHNCHIFEAERAEGLTHPSEQEVAQNRTILEDSRKEIFSALQDLLLITRYMFLREV
jgi:hypothetical protein